MSGKHSADRPEDSRPGNGSSPKVSEFSCGDFFL